MIPDTDNKGTILLVEDEPAIRQLLAGHLEAAGYTPIETASGPEALEYLQDNQVDAVILDIALPYISGVGVARKLKVTYPQLPILVLTAYAQEAPLALTAQQEADYLLEKVEFAKDPKSLLNPLDQLVEKSKQQN